MKQEIPSGLYPVIVLQDRYGGVYSGGEWIAIRDGNALVGSEVRAAWVVKHGPSGTDLDAASFWSDPPAWVAVGPTPDDAVQHLFAYPLRDKHSVSNANNFGG
jgi:hypothetical protein